MPEHLPQLPLQPSAKAAHRPQPNSASRTHRYLSALASGYVVAIATVVVGFWLTPFTLKYLDREQFAVFTLAGDVLTWLGLIDLGFVSVLSARAAQLSGRPDQAELDRIASTTFFAQLATALAVLVVGAGIVWFFPSFFALTPGVRADATRLVAIMVIGSAVTVASQTFSALLFAHQQAHVDNLLRLGLIAVRTIVTVALLNWGVGLLSLGWANLVATVAMAAAAVYRVRRYLPSLSISRSHFDWATLHHSGHLGIWFSLGGLAGVLILNLDRIVTAKLVSVETVTTLALTGRVYALAWTFVQLTTNMARPGLSQMLGAGGLDQTRTAYHRLVRLSTGLAMVSAACLWAGNGHFVRWWVGQGNYGGATLDALLALNVVVHAWILPNRALLVAGLAYVPQNAMSRLVEGLVNLVLSIALGLAWGLNGILAATAIAGILTSSWYFPYLTARYFRMRTKELLWKDLPEMVALALMAIAAGIAARSVPTSLTGPLGATAAFAMCLVACLPAMWYLALDRGTRRIILTEGIGWTRLTSTQNATRSGES